MEEIIRLMAILRGLDADEAEIEEALELLKSIAEEYSRTKRRLDAILRPKKRG